MDIVYYLTILPPSTPEVEAVAQEVEVLRDSFGGEVVYVNPNRHLPLSLPRVAFGLDKLRQIRDRESEIEVHHLFNPDPFPFPLLRALRRPVIYSLTGGMRKKPINVSFFNSLNAVTVADNRSLDYLRSIGVKNAFRVQPGIDTDRFTSSSIPLRSEVRLLVGSAPWTPVQFQKKGIEALLDATRKCPRLRLVFLWRNVLTEEMERRVRRMGLQKRVDVLNEKVDVNRILASVHASIALATDPSVIRPYPHSLMESLVAGKPVITSRSIALADYVEQEGCGVVVESIDSASILDAVETLTQTYDNLLQATQMIERSEFSQQKTIASYQKVYENVLEIQNPT